MIEFESPKATTMDGLTDELCSFCEAQSLPLISADELLHHVAALADTAKLTGEAAEVELRGKQQRWISRFISAWEKAETDWLSVTRATHSKPMIDRLKLQGFTPEHVGGGCSLMSNCLPNGGRVWISATDGQGMPEDGDWLVVAYSPADECEGVLSLSSDNLPYAAWPQAVKAALLVANVF